MSMEIWKAIDNFPGYEVSDMGNVRTFLLIGGRGVKGIVPRLVRQVSRPPKPYKRVFLSNGFGKKCPKQVHRLVLSAFVGPCPDGMECRHLDGNGENNSVSNLEWATHKINVMDRATHDTNLVGVRNPKAILSELDVLSIKTKSDWKYGDISKIARELGVTPQTIFKIKNNQLWTSV